MTDPSVLAHDSFVRRHVGTDPDAQRHMLDVLGFDSLDELLTRAVPGTILLEAEDRGVVPPGIDEAAAVEEPVRDAVDQCIGTHS